MKSIIKSIQTRLKNTAKKTNKDYVYILRSYFQERFLYRLSISNYQDKLFLKGGLLLSVLKTSEFRTTKDIDLLGKNIDGTFDIIKSIFVEIISIPFEEDGVTFDKKTITTEKIKENDEYEGIRLKIDCKLGNIKQKIIFDVGFGDIIIPKPQKIKYPTLLNSPVPIINAYSLESVIAEKTEAICKLGNATSRMKDFFDIIFLSENFSFNFNTLKKAIFSTFKNRKTNIALFNIFISDDFIRDKEKYWKAFLNRIHFKEHNDFQTSIHNIRIFLSPIFEKTSKAKKWIPKFKKWQSK